MSNLRRHFGEAEPDQEQPAAPRRWGPPAPLDEADQPTPSAAPAAPATPAATTEQEDRPDPITPRAPQQVVTSTEQYKYMPAQTHARMAFDERETMMAFLLRNSNVFAAARSILTPEHFTDPRELIYAVTWVVRAVSHRLVALQLGKKCAE
jgi:hypothetical protein